MNLLLVLLLLCGMALVIVGSIRLAARILRFVRKHRGEVIGGGVGEQVRGWVTAALEDWVDSPPPSHGDTSDHGADGHSSGDHHVSHSGDSSSH